MAKGAIGIESLIDKYGLKAVVNGLAAACRNKADRAKEIGENVKHDAWQADQITIERVLPLLVNDKTQDGLAVTAAELARLSKH